MDRYWASAYYYSLSLDKKVDQITYGGDTVIQCGMEGEIAN